MNPAVVKGQSKFLIKSEVFEGSDIEVSSNEEEGEEMEKVELEKEESDGGKQPEVGSKRRATRGGKSSKRGRGAQTATRGVSSRQKQDTAPTHYATGQVSTGLLLLHNNYT